VVNDVERKGSEKDGGRTTVQRGTTTVLGLVSDTVGLTLQLLGLLLGCFGCLAEPLARGFLEAKTRLVAAYRPYSHSLWTLLTLSLLHPSRQALGPSPTSERFGEKRWTDNCRRREPPSIAAMTLGCGRSRQSPATPASDKPNDPAMTEPRGCSSPSRVPYSL
jgi:hypothetical protein